MVNIFIKISSVSAVLFLFIMTNSLPTSGFAIFYYFIHYRILSAAIEVFSNVLIQLLKDHFLIPLCLLFSLQTLYLLAKSICFTAFSLIFSIVWVSICCHGRVLQSVNFTVEASLHFFLHYDCFSSSVFIHPNKELVSYLQCLFISWYAVTHIFRSHQNLNLPIHIFFFLPIISVGFCFLLSSSPNN